MRLVSLALFALLLPATAVAQDRGIFVDVGGSLGIRFTASADGDPTLFSLGGSPTYEWNDLNGDRRWQPGEEGSLLPSSLLRQTSKGRVAPGVSASLGVFLSPAVSLRLEGLFQAEYVTTMATSGFTSSTDLTHAAAIQDFTAAAAWHQSVGSRVRLAYLGGIVFRRQQDETTLSYQYVLRNLISPTGSSFSSFPLGQSYEQEFKSTSYATGVMTGIEVGVKLSDSFALVPQVRMVATGNEWHLRPAIALRWRP